MILGVREADGWGRVAVMRTSHRGRRKTGRRKSGPGSDLGLAPAATLAAGGVFALALALPHRATPSPHLSAATADGHSPSDPSWTPSRMQAATPLDGSGTTPQSGAADSTTTPTPLPPVS